MNELIILKNIIIEELKTERLNDEMIDYNLGYENGLYWCLIKVEKMIDEKDSQFSTIERGMTR